MSTPLVGGLSSAARPRVCARSTSYVASRPFQTLHAARRCRVKGVASGRTRALVLSVYSKNAEVPSPKELSRLEVSSQEEQLMAAHTLPVSTPCRPVEDADEAAFRLINDGCVHLSAVLGEAHCDALLDEVDYKIAEVDRYRSEHAFLGGAPSRYDLKLPLDGITLRTVQASLSSGLASILLKVAGESALLAELGVLASTPGAKRQPMHPDTVCTGEAEERPLYTTFIALQDVNDLMGPTCLIPGTNTLEAHRALCGIDQPSHIHLLSTTPNIRGTIRKGDCITFDSRTIHCGAENKSDLRRVLMYISVQSPAPGCTGLPPYPQRRTPPSAYSMLAEYHNRFPLKSFPSWHA